MKEKLLAVVLAAMLPLAASAQERQDMTSRLTNPSFENGDLTGWTYGNITDGDIGVRENSNSIYTTAGCNGSWMFNTWFRSNDYTFVAPNQYVEQTVKSLPQGEYRLVALAASDTYTSVKTPVELYANDASLSFLPPHKSTFTEYELPFYVSPYTLNVKLGMKSASWFKCDNFRLYYLGETDAWREAMGGTAEPSSQHPALVEIFNGFSADGWTFTEIGGHTHGDFPIATNNMDLTPFEASKFQFWTGPAYTLGNARITYSYTGLPQGWYEFRSQVRIYDENGDFDGTTSGLSILCGNATHNITEGNEIADGSLPGLGFTGEYSVIAQVGTDGRLTVGFRTENCSFNWLSWLNARVLYHGTQQPVESHWFEQLNALAAIADQATDAAGLPAIILKAQADMKAATTDSEAEAVLQTVRTAILQLVKSTPARDGQYDLTALITNPDMTDGPRGWTATNTTLRCSESGVGSVSGTTKAASIRQQLAQMPAGHYTLMVQGFYRTTETAAFIHDFEQGTEDVKASLLLGSQRTPLRSVMYGRRFQVERQNGIQATIDGRAIPNSIAAVPAWLKLGDYWNTIDFYLAEDGTLDLGIDISATSLPDNWTVFTNFMLFYGDEAAEVTLTDNDTEFSIAKPRKAHVTLQRSFKAGVLTPLCLPFDIDAGSFFELYAVGDCDEKTALLYPVQHVRAGEPCVVKMNDAVSSIDFGTVVLCPVADDTRLLPWGNGGLQQSYIKSVRRESNYCWKYVPVAGSPAVAATSLSFLTLSPMQMDFTVSLENYSARRFLSENTYTLTNASAITNYYTTPPPKRRDVPNPVMVPVPDTGASDVYVEWSERADFEDAERRNVLKGELAYVPNLIPQRTYNYRVVAGGNVVSKGQFHTDGRLRMIYAPSANNIRDLGGWATADMSKRVAYGRIFRGSELNGAHVATDFDLQVLRDLGIKAEIDLRWNSSWDNDGVGISAFGFTDTYFFAAGNDWLAEDLAKEESQQHWRDEFNLVVKTLKAGKSVYFHCVWGADRTGLFAMLLEGLLGLSFDPIFKDYELTSYSLAGLREKNGWQDRMDYINGLEGESLRDKFENYFVNTLKIPLEDINYFRSVMLENVGIQPEYIDENVDYVCRQNGKTDATAVCTLQPGQRNAIVLPFALSSVNVLDTFDSDVTLETITGLTDGEIVTKRVYSTTAHVPFLITPASVPEDHTYTFKGITLVRGGARSVPFTGGSLCGLYAAETDVQSLAVAEHTSYVMRNASFYKADEKSPKVRGLHAYLMLDTPSESAVRNIVYFQGETPDGIAQPSAPLRQVESTDEVFDLTGRRIAPAQPLKPGIYVVGGRKILVR